MTEQPPARVQVSIDLDESRIREIARQVVREELRAAVPTTAPLIDFVSRARAAKACGVGAKKVRQLVKSGAVQVNAMNRVSIAQVREALESKAPAQPTDALAWARQRAQRKGG